MKLFDCLCVLALAVLTSMGSARDYAEPEGFDVNRALHSRGIDVGRLPNTSSTKLTVSYEHCAAAVGTFEWRKFYILMYFAVLGT
jgi:hypothetical protein